MQKVLPQLIPLIIYITVVQLNINTYIFTPQIVLYSYEMSEFPMYKY